MSAPLDFLKIFARRLRAADIRFAITAGMACVHYGLQQATKDSDWIIAPDDLGKLRELLVGLEQAAPPWHVSYRQIFGSPVDAEFMAHGWTSHLLLTDPDGVEHKVDLFGKAPRVQNIETEPGDADYASRHVVALMKHTDRDRDWPVAKTRSAHGPYRRGRPARNSGNSVAPCRGARQQQRRANRPTASTPHRTSAMKIVPAEPEIQYSEEYYEHLARTMGEEHAAWARLPRAEREKELRWYHENFNTPDDLAEWPPELDGGRHNGFTFPDVPDRDNS